MTDTTTYVMSYATIATTTRGVTRASIRTRRTVAGLAIVFGAALLSAAASAQQWLELSARDLPVTVSASGLVTSAEVVRFGPPPSQSWRITITELAREGQRVDTGDTLARFDSSGSDDRVRDLEGQLAESRSELASFQEIRARDVEQEKLDIADALSKANKAAQKADQPAELLAGIEYEKLVEDRRISAQLLETARSRLGLSASVREARQQELEADIRRLEIQLRSAQDELDSFTLRAPRPGLVIVGTDRQGAKLDVNSSVNPGIVVIELVDDRKLQVQAEVPEHASAQIALGQTARVFVDAVGSNELPGRVKEVANIVRRQSRNSQTMVRDVVIELASADSAGLRPGMSVTVTVEVDRLKGAVSLPQSALVYRDGKPGVELRNGSWQPVQLGARSDDEFIVLGGVSAGQEVRL
jgi:HlyD family secretion protein